MFKSVTVDSTSAKASTNSSPFHRKSDQEAFIQPKLNIGKPGDKYEVEADKAADQIVAKGNQPTPFFPATPVVQKQSEEDIQQQPVVDSISSGIQLKENPILQKTKDSQAEDDIQMVAEENSLQTKKDSDSQRATPITNIQPMFAEDLQTKEEEEVQEKEEEEVQTVQKQSTGDDGSNMSSIESDLSNSKGGGSPLDTNTRSEMESGFGTDFSGVRVHNDSNAVQMNQQLGSQAFTNGSDVYFNEGKYNPASDSGKHLLAHELTHTAQQGASVQPKMIQKTEDNDGAVSEPTSPIDITNGLRLSEEWLTYIETNSRQRKFMVPVKIGEQFIGTIALKKLGRAAEGEPRKFELNHPRRENYLDVGGMEFLNPLRNAGVHPILVLNSFGEEQQTSGFLSIRRGEEALTRDVLGIIKGINENLESMSFLGLSPIEGAEGLQNDFTSGGLNFSASDLSLSVDGYLEAQASIGISNSSFTFEVSATIDVAGLAEGELQIARGEDGGLSGNATISADIANVNATIQVDYDRGAVTIQGTGRMNSEKFTGEITFLVTDAAKSQQMMHAALGVTAMDAEAESSAPADGTAVAKTKDNQVLAGWGTVQASITSWLEGTASIGIDNEGHVTIVGEIVVPDEIELMEQRGQKTDLFDVEIRGGYGIPLVGQVFLFASVGMFVNAGFGPLVLKNVGFTGTYSTDPNVLQQFSITGTLGINAFAVIGLEAEAGVGVTLIGHDIKAGVNVTAAAGLRAYAEATPTFEYSESQAPEGGKVGESHLRGHFEAAAQLFLQLTGALFYELDSPWWSPAPDGREEFPLGEVQYPIGDSMGIGADIDWLVGSPEAPELTFSPVEFDPDKFTADVMADPPPRPLGNADAEPAGEWTGEPGSDQNANPEITGDGEGLPPNSRREEDLSNLPDEQKYMRALDELSRMEDANPKPTISVVDAEIRKVKRKYGITKIESRDEQDAQVSIYVEHARENNSRHLLNIPLMSQAERTRLLLAAKEALQTSSRSAADEEGKITRADAEQVLTTLKRNHPVIAEGRVVDGQNTWDYFIDIGDREENETGEAKKEIEENGSGDFTGIDDSFTTETGDSHTLYLRESSNGQYEIIIESTPTVFEDFIMLHFNRIESPTEEMISTKDSALQKAREVDRIITGLTSDEEITEEDRTEVDQKLDDLASVAIAFIDASTISDIPEENIVWGSKIGSFGSSMSMTYLKSKTTGQESSNLPFQENQILMQRKNTGGQKYYRNGHLLNANLHGPDDWKNLTPLSSSGNSRHLHQIEAPLKDALPTEGNPEFKAFKYVVIASYSRGINTSLITQVENSENDYVIANKDTILDIIRSERYVPTSLRAESVELKNVNGNWTEKSSGNYNISTPNIPNLIGDRPEDYRVTNERVLSYPVAYSTATRADYLNAGFSERTVDAILLAKSDDFFSTIGEIDSAEKLHPKILENISGPGGRVTLNTIKRKINF